MRNKKKHTNNPFDDIKLEVTFEALLLISELSKTAMKVFVYIAGESYKENGIVYLDRKELKNFYGFKEDKSIYNGLVELIHRDILASTEQCNEFYYNPMFIDNRQIKISSTL
jgi:hypothetical protein